MAKTKLASWAFLIGFVLALIGGIVAGVNSDALSTNTYLFISVILLIVGIVVGLFNVTAGETTPFLFSGLCLIIASSIGASQISYLLAASENNWILGILGTTLSNLLLIFTPATIIVAIKNVFNLSKR